MLNSGDITNAWAVWKAAGLAPPMITGQVQAAGIMKSMLRQYSEVDKPTWERVVDKLARGKRWPQFVDIDEALKEERRRIKLPQQTISATRPMLSAPERKLNIAKVREIIAHIDNAGSFKGLIAPPSSEVIAHARKLFPECTDDFIRRNHNELLADMRAWQDCESGNNCANCTYAGHRPFLKVNPKSGDTYPCVELEVCGNYTPIKQNDEKAV